MSTLVTGGSGFIGVNLVRQLAEQKRDVVSFSRGGYQEGFDHFIGSNISFVRFVNGDVLDLNAIRSTIKEYGVEVFIHAAAVTPINAALERSAGLHTVQVNVGGTISALEAAVTEGVKRFVYVGSATVYGRRDPHRAISEDVVIQPEGLYAITKRTGELLCLRYHELFETLDVRIVRISSIYGPMERPTPTRHVPSQIYDLCAAAVSGRRAEVGDAGVKRDFTYVDDTIRGILLVACAAAPAHRIYNVSSGKQQSLLDVLGTIQKLEPGFHYTIRPQAPEKAFPSSYLRGPLDITRARSEFGFEPKFDLKTGLQNYLEWLRSRHSPVRE